MKKALYATAGSALALVLLAANAPAFADVNVTATINKTKDITVTEQITINKTVHIVVASTFTPDDIKSAAEATALLNVDNENQSVDGQDTNIDPVTGVPKTSHSAGDTDYHLSLSAVMDGSVNSNTGVFGFNQDVGNMTNQGNVVSVAGVSNLKAFANAQAEADQENSGNTVQDYELVRNTEGGLVTLDEAKTIVNTLGSAGFLVEKSASMTGSVSTNTGIINVNQNAGNMNNQSNGVAIAVGLGALVALSESALGQENSGNTVTEVETVKRDTITNSINSNVGIVSVNQSVGNMNQQANVVSLAAVASGAILTTP